MQRPRQEDCIVRDWDHQLDLRQLCHSLSPEIGATAATPDELSEALVVCIEMGGGPGAVYAARALAAYDEIA
jgi:hypothetical protein